MHQANITRGREWLARTDLRPTRQRVALAALLVGDGRDRHVTAEGLHAAAREAGESVSLATVYNTLRTFCSAGLMLEIMVGGTKSYFDTRIDDHPHFYWEDTGALTDAPAADMCFACVPQPPPGAEIAKVEVVIRLRRSGADAGAGAAPAAPARRAPAARAKNAPAIGAD